MTSLDQLLADADFPTQKISICLKGSLLAEWETANGELLRAEAARELAAEKKMPMGAPTRDVQSAQDVLTGIEERMRAASIDIHMTAMGTSAYQKFCAAYPPRVSDDGVRELSDIRIGFNSETGWKPLVRACITAPNMTDDQFDRLLDRLTFKQFDMLAGTAYALNRETDGQLPFSSAVSDLTRSSGETSSKPASSGSPSGRSGASGGRASKTAKAGRKRSGTSSPAT